MVLVSQKKVKTGLITIKPGNKLVDGASCNSMFALVSSTIELQAGGVCGLIRPGYLLASSTYPKAKLAEFLVP